MGVCIQLRNGEFSLPTTNSPLTKSSLNTYGLIAARKYARIAPNSESLYTPITEECRQLLPSVTFTDPASAFRCTGGADLRSYQTGRFLPSFKTRTRVEFPLLGPLLQVGRRE